jgi:hypothetical protein
LKQVTNREQNTMKVVIIHRPERTDRIRNIAKLLDIYPDAVIEHAAVPAWVDKPIDKAMRGCTLSHLNCIRKHLTNEPLLVLEDDAVAIPENLAELPNTFPANALAVVVGGDVDQFGDELDYGFRKVLPKFFGTQAMIYLPSIWQTPFLLNAYALTANNHIGHAPNGGSICFESMLLQSTMGTGKAFYRPRKMCFTTMGDLSDTWNRVDKPRMKAIEAIDRPGLIPESAFADIFEPYSGLTVYLSDEIPGNPGDRLIQAATRQLFRYYKITETKNPADAAAFFYPGGGNIGGQYQFPQIDAFFEMAKGKPTIVLPQTWMHPDKHGDKITKAFVRDEESLKFRPDAILVPDLSLAYRTALVGEHLSGEGFCVTP